MESNQVAVVRVEVTPESESPEPRTEALEEVLGDALIRLDPSLPGVRSDSAEVRLTRTEYRLIEYLAAEQPRWVKAGELLDNVLAAQVNRDTTLVRVHLLNIRKKLGALSCCVTTERRLGTRFWRTRPANSTQR